MTAKRNDGAGRLRQRSPGVWEGSVWHGGKQKSKTFRVEGVRRAEAAFRDWRATLPAEPARGTFGALLDDWLLSIAEDVEPSTMRGYRDIATAVKIDLGDIALGDLKGRMVEDYYRTLATPAKAHHYHAIIRRALNHAVRRELITYNPVAGKRVDLPKHHRAQVAPPVTAVADALIRGAFDRDETLGAMVFLAVSTGARRGELLGLRWDAVDLEAGTLHFHRSLIDVGGTVMDKDSLKTHQDRTVDLDAVTIELLRRHGAAVKARASKHGAIVHSSGYLFSWAPDCSTYITPNYVAGWWRRLRATVPGAGTVRLHDLRHLMATRWLEAGETIAVVAGRLGHATITTTLDYYTHVMPDAQRGAAERMSAQLPQPRELGSAS